jgi:hypothetical protein
LILSGSCDILGWEAGKPDGYYLLREVLSKIGVKEINSG